MCHKAKTLERPQGVIFGQWFSCRWWSAVASCGSVAAWNDYWWTCYSFNSVKCFCPPRKEPMGRFLTSRLDSSRRYLAMYHWFLLMLKWRNSLSFFLIFISLLSTTFHLNFLNCWFLNYLISSSKQNAFEMLTMFIIMRKKYWKSNDKKVTL